MKKYKNIFLDWDGTMANTLPSWFESFTEVFDELNMTPKPNEIAGLAFRNKKDLLANFSLAEVDSFYDKLINKFEKFYLDTQLNLNVKQTLMELNNSEIKLAIVTSSYKRFIYPILEKFDISKYIEFIIDAEDTLNDKPAAEPILVSMQKLGANGSDCIMIGDSVTDILAGNNAGIDTAAFFPDQNAKYHNKEELEQSNPTYFISNFSELIDFV